MREDAGELGWTETGQEGHRHRARLVDALIGHEPLEGLVVADEQPDALAPAESVLQEPPGQPIRTPMPFVEGDLGVVGQFRHATAAGNAWASWASNSGWSSVMAPAAEAPSVGGTALEDRAGVLYQHPRDVALADAPCPHDREHLVGDIGPSPVLRDVHDGAWKPVHEAHGVVGEHDPVRVAAGTEPRPRRPPAARG